MNLKDTLLMPKTNFEMRGNLPNKEPNILEKWDNQDIYNKSNLNKDNTYMLHDGPPYANGAMHCGHMLNRLLKDFIVRYKNMSGYNTPFIFGWDTHGLPIENMVTKMGVNRKLTPINEFREKCYEYALNQVEKQKKDIKRLGCFGDYKNPYLTLHKEFEAREIHCFSVMAQKGLIYKGLKPVYWSPSSESALAEAEIEYQDVKAKTIYVSFDIKKGNNLIYNDAKFIIWTTTPWTLPANLALCVNPKLIYGLYETDIGKVIFLSDLKENLKEILGFKICNEIKLFEGKELEGIIALHPFYNKESYVILGDYVTSETGTGIVHIAPGHGMDDYLVCLKYNIKPYCPVDEKGKMMEDCGERLAGLFYEDANDEVIKILEENNHLLKEIDIVHSYPHDWRTHKPVIFRATKQWFCSIEPIRNKIIEEIKKVDWNPKWGETRMINMIKDRNDWCISRQRVWGVPIPIIYCEDDTPIIEKEVFDHIESLIREKGSNIWYELSEKELLPEGYKNPHSPNNIFKKEKDIMDVWFDSGSSWNGVLNERNLSYPADLYLEGSDQYRGRFNSSLILSVALNEVSPYKSIVSHGFVLDENWEKMSKSKGNGIDPLKIINIYGSDTLRLWASLIDYQQDVKLSEGIIKTISEQYRKIRNTFKFLLGNIYTLNKDEHIEIKELIDKCVLAKFSMIKNEYLDSMDSFNFINATTKLINFMSNDLSSFYLDIVKDILYCEDKESSRRKEVVYVLNYLLKDLMIMLNPILPFTMDEVNSNYIFKDFENVMSYQMVTKNDIYFDPLLLKVYDKLKDLRDDVLRVCESKRNLGLIKSNLEAEVKLNIFDDETKKYFSNLSQVERNRFFIVSSSILVDEVLINKGKVSYVEVYHVNGEKCNRCWNYFKTEELTQVDEDKVCQRCLKVLKK